MPLIDKINIIAKEIYRAKKVVIKEKLIKKLEKFESLSDKKLLVCIAKTQYSFSDDPKKLGAPQDYDFEISDVQLSAGAGFVVCLAGKIITMPGLPKEPAANNLDIDENNKIVGLF